MSVHPSVRKVIRQYLVSPSVEPMRRPHGPMSAEAALRELARRQTVTRRTARRLALG